jgi:hypothetical protein
VLYAFDADGRLLAKTPALFGAVRSDTLTDAQASKDLNDVLESDKITPAGLFQAHGFRSASYGDAVRFASFERTNLLIHRGFDADRIERLRSTTNGDNRITYGCINALPDFVGRVLLPNFSGDSLVVILPETQSAASFFGIPLANAAVLATAQTSYWEVHRRSAARWRTRGIGNGEQAALDLPRRHRSPASTVAAELLANTGRKRTA